MFSDRILRCAFERAVFRKILPCGEKETSNYDYYEQSKSYVSFMPKDILYDIFRYEKEAQNASKYKKTPSACTYGTLYNFIKGMNRHKSLRLEI